jgi:nucleotide-binding universal stress UspA family protein
MKKIVIPTDFSEYAEKAYHFAADLARKSDLEVVLLHISSRRLEYINSWMYMDIPTQIMFDENAIDSLNAEAKMQALLVSPVFDDVNISYQILDAIQANPIKEMLNFLNKKEHQLVVMGTSGDDVGSDSNAEYIARKSVVPVLTLKKDTVVQKGQTILMPTDFKTVDKKFMKGLERIAAWLELDVKFVFINTPKHFKDTDKIEKEWLHFKEKYQVSFSSFEVFNDHHVEQGILKMIGRDSPVMIALPTHGRTGLAHLLNGSFTEDLINEVDVPVYSYNMHNDYHTKSYNTIVETRGFTG